MGGHKRADEEEEPMMGGAAEAPRPRGEKDARNLTVDFTKLDMATLKRYKRHYRLKTRQNVTKTELALAVAKHVAHEHEPGRDAAEALQEIAATPTMQMNACAGAWEHSPFLKSPSPQFLLDTT